MFEKEAEEYCLKRTGYGKDEFHGRKLRQAYESGAEFGYNKAKEENAELKDEIERDKDLPTIAYLQGAEKQKKKDKVLLTKAKKLLKN